MNVTSASLAASLAKTLTPIGDPTGPDASEIGLERFAGQGRRLVVSDRRRKPARPARTWPKN